MPQGDRVRLFIRVNVHNGSKYQRLGRTLP